MLGIKNHYIILNAPYGWEIRDYPNRTHQRYTLLQGYGKLRDVVLWSNDLTAVLDYIAKNG